MKKYGLLPFLILALTGVLASLASSPSERKGRMFLLQGMQQEVEGNLAEAYALYRHALETDPGNKAALLKTGMFEVIYADSASLQKSMDKMKDYVEAYPADFNEGMLYAQVCEGFDKPEEAYRVIRRLHTLYPENTRLLNKLAELATYLEMPDTALAFLNEQERADGPSLYLTTCKMVVYLSKEDTASVLRETDDVLRRNPHDPDYYILKAGVMEQFADKDSALVYYQMADSLFPGNWSVKSSLASYYESVGDSAAMRQAVYDAMLTEDAELEDKLELYTSIPLSGENGDSAHTDKVMEALEEQYPYSAKLRYIQAQYNVFKGDLSKAADQMTIAVDMDPTDAQSRLMQMQYLIGSGRYAEAVEAFRRTPAELAKALPTILLTGASAYQGAEMYPEALAIVDSLLHTITYSEEPDTIPVGKLEMILTDAGMSLFCDAMSEKGNILFMSGEPLRGIKAYDKALEIDPDEPLVLNNYAYFMAKAGMDLPRAEQMSLRCVTMEPDNPVYLDTYAYILFLQHNYGHALTYMEKAIEKIGSSDDTGLASPSAEYYEHYGDILSRLGQTAKAVEMWRKALEMDPSREILKQKIKTKTYIDE